jgi:hypothetical protein
MFDLGALSSARKTAEGNYEKLAEDFNEEYNQALQYLKEFTESQNPAKLKQAASKFFNAVKCKRSRIEPYLYLSYIFYLFDENQLANEYLEIAKSIDSGNPKIQELQQLLITS